MTQVMVKAQGCALQEKREVNGNSGGECIPFYGFCHKLTTNLNTFIILQFCWLVSLGQNPSVGHAVFLLDLLWGESISHLSGFYKNPHLLTFGCIHLPCLHLQTSFSHSDSLLSFYYYTGLTQIIIAPIS